MTFSRSTNRGFTLVELAIAMVVIGILAAIALPGFMDSVRKSRRAEAIRRLSDLQQAQERWRSNNPTYASSLDDLRLPATIDGGYYQLAVVGASTYSAYSATATAVTGRSQASDSACTVLVLKMVNGSIYYESQNSAGAQATGATNPCWGQP